MSELGVFAVDRGVFDHPLLDDGQPFTKREAWLWLVAEAAWKPRGYNISGTVVQLQRGQLAHSVRYMAAAWRWPKSNVARFLGRLKSGTMIVTEDGTAATIITICKYDVYQRVSLPSGTANGTGFGTEVGQQRDRKEDIQDIQSIPQTPKGPNGDQVAKSTTRRVDDRYGDNADPLYTDFLANIWANRWKRKGHEPLPAFRAYARLSDPQRLACKGAIQRVGRVIEASASEERFRPLLASWLNKHGWEADSESISSTSAAAVSDEEWAKRLRRFFESNVWAVAWGAKPNEIECLAPRFMIDAARRRAATTAA